MIDSKPKRKPMKKIAPFMFFCIALNVFGQSHAVSVPQKTNKFSVQFEVGLNNFHNYGDPLFDRYDVSQSHYEAVAVEKELNSAFSASFGIRNINYGLKATVLLTDINGNPTGENGVLNYNYWTIQTPLQLKIKPFKSKQLSFNFGGYLGFNYLNYATSSTAQIKVNQNENKQLMDIGLISGMEYEWFKKGNFTLGNSISYYVGFSDLNSMEPFFVAFGIPHIVTKSEGLTIGFTGKWTL